MSTLVAHPKKGIAVRKLFDPHGVSKPALIERKAQFARDVPSSRLPQHLGTATTPSGGQMHFSSFVPGRTVGSEGTKEFKTMRDIAPQKKQLELQSRSRGYEARDLHSDNIMTTQRGGRPEMKAVDVIPTRGKEDLGDLIHRGKHQSAIMGDEYYQPDRKDVMGDIKRNAFTGKPRKIVPHDFDGVLEPEPEVSTRSLRKPAVGE